MSLGKKSVPNVDTLTTETAVPACSAIDTFYSATKAITTIPPNLLASHSGDIVGLIFVGLISATENYFRDILGFILSVCPIAQSHSADEKIQLGSLLWAPAELHNRTAFEFMAFSSGENIRKTVQNFINYQVKKNGTWEAMLPEYDKLCEFRHAIVHSGHVLAGKNAVKLGLKKSPKCLRVCISYANLQTAAEICTAFIQAANNELFEEVIGRWADGWRSQASWCDNEQERLFNVVYQAFLSKRDYANKTFNNRCAKKKLMAMVKAEYNLT
jgi:hypothetical protein